MTSLPSCMRRFWCSSTLSCTWLFYVCSEFSLPWFNLDVREAKESVRTTRSRAKATKTSTTDSSGLINYMYMYRCTTLFNAHPQFLINAHPFYLMPTVPNHSWPFPFLQLRNPDTELTTSYSNTRRPKCTNLQHSVLNRRQRQWSISQIQYSLYIQSKSTTCAFSQYTTVP